MQDPGNPYDTIQLMQLTAYIEDQDKFHKLAQALESGPVRAYAPHFFHGYLLAALKEAVWGEAALLVVAPDTASAGRLAADLAVFSPAPVRLLPGLSAVAGGGLISSSQAAGHRHAALAALAGGEKCIVVAEATALMERDLDPSGWPAPLTIGKNGRGQPGFDRIIELLAGLGYERTPQVEEPGQFSVRGGIIDFFSSTQTAPMRAEFWGDELESLRRLSPFTQRSLSSESETTVYVTAEPERGGGRGGGLLLVPPAGLIFCLVDPALAQEPVNSFWEDVSGLLEGEEPGAHFLSPEELEGGLDAGVRLTVDRLPQDQPYQFPVTGINFGSRRPAESTRQLERLVGQGLKVFIYFATEGAARRAEHILAGKASLLETGGRLPDGPGAWLVAGAAPAGFVSKELGLAVFGERALLRPSRAARSQQLALGGRSLLSFRDLTPGDYVVHQDHGIGIFESIETKTVAGVTRDYLDLRFKGDDRLYVPQEQIFKVSRYIGAGTGAPPLNKLGGRAWGLARARARSAAREMAGELLQLYAVRQNLPGRAFDPDGKWQMELEAAFPYLETPDQAAAIEDVKDDMESPHPMDRLICGDVGYGKTEVALRAAFKAASQGKQVLMLVPTTLLALQHFGTFSTRFKPFPVQVEMISRFRSPAEGRRIAAAFRDGKIDVLIGTHRVLSADVVPRDLGLVIVDEEQRFGVVQKETLRQLRLKVDVLSLSATPIPRTLQMSLAGIRDISVMETPPPGRNPIRTFVGEYDDGLVTQAVKREAGRGGQVFFLHNRVETIEEKAEELRALMPGMVLLVAHGQMPERQLESVMVSFLNREAAVLVCTSIIESGLDIPTANTLIVDHADQLGLAQLYQIRGRIGRSEATAHAYLLYPPAALLTPEAVARLSTLSEYTELGSGFRIAMRDLEIRGAGNLLGDEQSGHVAAVGFDMYCDLLKRAVADLKDKPIEESRVARLDVDVDAFIPADYIPLEAARIDIHHRIAAARDEQGLAEVRTELEDRFGPVPEVVYNLLSMQEIRLRAGVLGAASLTWRRDRLELSDLKLDASQRAALEEAGLKFAYHPLKRTLALWPRPGLEAGGGLSVVKETLDAIIGSLLIPMAKL